LLITTLALYGLTFNQQSMPKKANKHDTSNKRKRAAIDVITEATDRFQRRSKRQRTSEPLTLLSAATTSNTPHHVQQDAIIATTAADTCETSASIATQELEFDDMTTVHDRPSLGSIKTDASCTSVGDDDEWEEGMRTRLEIADDWYLAITNQPTTPLVVCVCGRLQCKSLVCVAQQRRR
jgi:hypothetical protein